MYLCLSHALYVFYYKTFFYFMYVLSLLDPEPIINFDWLIDDLHKSDSTCRHASQELVSGLWVSKRKVLTGHVLPSVWRKMLWRMNLQEWLVIYCFFTKVSGSTQVFRTWVNPLKTICWPHPHFLQARQPVCEFYLKRHISIKELHCVDTWLWCVRQMPVNFDFNCD